MRSAVLLAALVVLLPQAAQAQVRPLTAGLVSPNVYPLYSLGMVRRNGGDTIPPGRYEPTHHATIFNRQDLLVRLSLHGDPTVAWVVRALPQIDVFDLTDPKTGIVERAGMRTPFDRRDVQAVDPTLRIPADLLDGTPFTIHIETSTEVREPLVETQAAMQREDDGTRSTSFLLIGFYIGVGLVFALLYFSLREKQLIFYAIVLFGLIVFEAINKTYAWQYLWPGASLEWHVPNALAFFVYYAALVLFCSLFLKSSGNLRWYRAAALALLALNAPAALGGALYHDISGVLLSEEVINGLLLAALLVWAYFAWRGGQRSARFYVVAFAGVCVGVVVNRLALDQVIPHTFFTEWIFEYGVLWEVVWLALAVASDLSETSRENAMLHAAEVQLQQLASRDGLTGVWNRRAFDERLDAEWKRALRAGRPLGLLLADVDFFKQYNDCNGHLAGDDCLRRVAEALVRVAARSSDFCARYGGEEFAILLPEADGAQAVALAEQMRAAVIELTIAHGAASLPHVTISIGATACVPDGRGSSAELVAAADAALYDAKRGGRNAVVERTL